ncbi:HAD-like protein [Dentipellis sp. KUC8613]|nr:HAD-like protein [Dentipellis sp. KUC8613]
MASEHVPEPRLTQFKALVFDVYGTLVDWESGIFTALHPLLARSPASRDWTRKEALDAFASVEKDLQAQHPELLYSELLAEVHRELTKRLGIEGAGAEAPVTKIEQGTSADAAVESESVDEHVRFGQSIGRWTPFPDTVDALQVLARHFKLVVLSNVDKISFARTQELLTPPGGKSPFSHIITAQDTGAYKPSHVMLERALADVKSKWGIEKDEVLVVAQSLFHDHKPANELGVPNVWIDRVGQVIGQDVEGVKWIWRFGTLGEMAAAVEVDAKQ